MLRTEKVSIIVRMSVKDVVHSPRSNLSYNMNTKHMGQSDMMTDTSIESPL